MLVATIPSFKKDTESEFDTVAGEDVPDDLKAFFNL